MLIKESTDQRYGCAYIKFWKLSSSWNIIINSGANSISSMMSFTIDAHVISVKSKVTFLTVVLKKTTLCTELYQQLYESIINGKTSTRIAPQNIYNEKN